MPRWVELSPGEEKSGRSSQRRATVCPIIYLVCFIDLLRHSANHDACVLYSHNKTVMCRSLEQCTLASMLVLYRLKKYNPWSVNIACQCPDNHFPIHLPQSPHCMSPVTLLNVQNVPFSTALPVRRIYNSDVASLHMRQISTTYLAIPVTHIFQCQGSSR